MVIEILPDEPRESKSLVEEARELLSKATPRPWAFARKAANLTEVYAVGGRGSVADISRWEGGIAGGDKENSANAVLIARAPDLLSSLCNEVESLTQDKKFLGERLEAQADVMSKVVAERNRLAELACHGDDCDWWITIPRTAACMCGLADILESITPKGEQSS